jgi:hypothetical protein
MDNRLKGFHTHRFRDNPEEQRFAEAWSKLNAVGRNVDYLLDASRADQRFTPEASEREARIAATVIQWLGSPVGQGFLRDLGYERSANAPGSSSLPASTMDLKVGDVVEVCERVTDAKLLFTATVHRVTPHCLIMKGAPQNTSGWYRRSDGRSIGGEVVRWIRIPRGR